MLRAVIVDDEELSVKRLNKLLSANGEVEIIGMFSNPMEAYEFVKEGNSVDVAFLDISMPEINGLKLSDLLCELDGSIGIVFVTGYDNYAVQAFDVSALDYIMKPVTTERLNKTLEKLVMKQRDKPVAPSIAVSLFNGFKLYRQVRDQQDREQPLKLRSPKTEELFAFLVCRRAASREEIADTLWNGLEPEKALKNLNSTLYYIRSAIKESGAENIIQAGRSEIRIVENSMYCDLYEFEQLLKQIRLTPEPNASLFEQLEVLYVGGLLQGKAYEWADERARQLERSYIELLEVAARYHLKQDQPQKSLHYFGEILKWDVIREDIYSEVIRLYIDLGRNNEALRQYHQLEQLLQRELGTKPDRRIQDLMTKKMMR
jgi:two-component system LytT family response regulator